MPGRTLRWFVEGEQSSIKANIGGTHCLDASYIPKWVHMSLRIGTKGARPMKIDITDDGTSIFDGNKPSINPEDTDKVWTTIPRQLMRDESIIKLNRDQVANIRPGEDLTVELYLEEV